jgi:regulator of protease activity HflC (stomatin/prohibitin superfamily)
MKNFFVGCLLVIFLLYFGIFTVNDNQVAILTNKYSKQVTIYKTGLHFMVPYIQNVEYISTRVSSSPLMMKLSLQQNGNKTDYIVSFAVNWRISYPLNYNKHILSSPKSEDVVMNQVKDIIQANINQFVKSNQGIDSDIVKIKSLTTKPIAIDKLGVTIESIKLLQIVYSSDHVSLGAINVTAQNEESNENSIREIESAYYMAQDIIAQTTVAKAKLYNELDKSNTKFYNYYRKLDTYKNTAKTKEDFPPLEQLY